MRFQLYLLPALILFPALLSAQGHIVAPTLPSYFYTHPPAAQTALSVEEQLLDSIGEEAQRSFYARSSAFDNGPGLSKASDVVFQLDSIKNDNIHLKFEYDQEGNNVVTERWFYNGFGGLSTLFRNVRAYEAEQLLSDTRISVDVETMEETPLFTLEYTYDGEGYLLTEKRSTWNAEQGSFVPQWLSTYETNEEGLLVSLTRCNFQEGDEPDCINSFQDIISYNEENLEILLLRSVWNQEEESWEWSVQWESEYEDVLILTEVRSGWNGEEWLPVQKQLHGYNDEGLLNYFEVQDYNQGGAAWDPSYRSTAEYNSEGRMLEFLVQNYFADNWNNSSRGNFEYDGPGNTIGAFYDFWNNNSSEWIEQSSDAMTYDLDVEAADVLPAWYNDMFINFDVVNKILEYTSVANPNEKISGENRTYYYSPFQSLSTVEVGSESIAIYPNPFRNQLIIQNSASSTPAVFTLHDLQGRVVMQGNVNAQTTLSMEGLKCGIYVYTLRGVQVYQSGKLVKVD